MPKDFSASDLARWKASSSSLSSRTIRIPLPPPPLVALIISGKPASSANCLAASKLSIGPSVPGITGKSALIAVVLALTLSPNISKCSRWGPINLIFSSAQRRANCSFSLRKPYPG